MIGLVGTNIQVSYVATGALCFVKPRVVTIKCKAQAGSFASLFVCVLVEVAPVCHYVNIHTVFESDDHDCACTDTRLPSVIIG